MEEVMSSTAEMNRIAYLNKKRKLHAELHGMPMSKHVCWGQSLEYHSSSDSIREPKKVESNKCSRRGESDPESVQDSKSVYGDTNFIMSTCNEAKNDLGYPKTCASDKPCTSYVSWDGISSGISIYSLESRSLIIPNSIKSEALSISEELDCPHNHYGLRPSLNYEEHLLEFGDHDNYSYSECINNGIEHCTDKELENLLDSNGVPPSNYVLSSGRWSVNQDTPQGAEKLTIDKEFEQYFSMLML